MIMYEMGSGKETFLEKNKWSTNQYLGKSLVNTMSHFPKRCVIFFKTIMQTQCQLV